MTPNQPPFILPLDYPRIRVVRSFEELVTTRFGDGVNALCWERRLEGDFAEVVERLGACEEITTLDDERLRGLVLSPAGAAAREILIRDQELMREAGLAPILDCIPGYPRDEEPGPVRTDVYSFHADSATTEADTYLCCYHGPASEGLRNDEAIRRVDLLEIRAELLNAYGGEDDEGFLEYLHENCYDLHYAPVAGAVPFCFGHGNLWRIAVQYEGSPVPPCVHRAPETLPGWPPRLLRIS